MPTYYVMDLDKGMAETVAAEMPSPPRDRSLQVAYRRRAWRVRRRNTEEPGSREDSMGIARGTDAQINAELRTFSGRTIDVPSSFISGKSDWGVYQNPGAVERMRTRACTKMVSFHLVDGAGHWVQQEQPEDVSRLIIQFLAQREQRP